MFEKILFVSESTQECVEAMQNFVKYFESIPVQIIALNIIDVTEIRHFRKVLDKSETEVIMEQEEEGWKYLYMVEDIAKEHNMKIMLQQREGHIESIIKEVVKEYDVDLLAIRGQASQRASLKNTEKMLANLIEKINCPLLIL